MTILVACRQQRGRGGSPLGDTKTCDYTNLCTRMSEKRKGQERAGLVVGRQSQSAGCILLFLYDIPLITRYTCNTQHHNGGCYVLCACIYIHVYTMQVNLNLNLGAISLPLFTFIFRIPNPSFSLECLFAGFVFVAYTRQKKRDC